MHTARIFACAVIAVGLAASNHAATSSSRTGEHLGPALAPGDPGGQASARARVAAMKAARLADVRAAASATSSKTIAVDCTKGQSIQAAIDKNAGAIVVTIHGVCSENVLIDGRQVTLRGSDPAVDGIRGVAMTGTTLATVATYDSPGTTLENLQIVDSTGIGVGAWNARTFTMTNCTVARSAGAGIHISGGSYFLGTTVTIANNNLGLRVQRSSIGVCTYCTLTNNGGSEAVSATGGWLSLVGSVVSGVNGLQATDASYADLDCVNVDDPAHACGMAVVRRAARAGGASEIHVLGVNWLEGSITAYDRSSVYLDMTRQMKAGTSPTGSPIPNDIGENASFLVYDAELTGNTFINTFARGIFYYPTTVNGSITCQQAGDAWLDSGVVVTPPGTVVGCAHAGS